MKSFVAASILSIASLAVAQDSYGGSAQTTGGIASAQGTSCKDENAMCESSYNTDDCDSTYATCKQTCTTKYNDCVGGNFSNTEDANHATCVANYTSCLGELPEDEVFTTVTAVVSTYTTYCPEATTVYNNGQGYVANGPTVLTITNCPCTITQTYAVAATGAAGSGSSASGASSGSSGSSDSSNGSDAAASAAAQASAGSSANGASSDASSGSSSSDSGVNGSGASAGSSAQASAGSGSAAGTSAASSDSSSSSGAAGSSSNLAADSGNSSASGLQQFEGVASKTLGASLSLLAGFAGVLAFYL